MDTNQPIITIKNLKKSYDGKKYVLSGIDVDIFPGQIIGYIGPNGAGKTTTVKILIGMLPDFEGQVTVFGNNVAENPVEVKERIGYVPETAALYDTLTPMEYLRFIGQIYRISQEEILSRSKKMLQLFGLKDHLNVRMNSFSKGMKQKVLVTAGMIHDPDILFLDEPLAGLDGAAARHDADEFLCHACVESA